MNPAHTIPAERLASWFEGKDFSIDYTSSNVPRWAPLLWDERNRIREVLEIGTLEGRTAIFWLEFLPNSTITCIDNFEGTLVQPSDPKLRAQIPLREQRFDANLASYGNRVRKIKSRSASALDALYYANESFDLIYVDGDHRCHAVLVDSALALQMLKPNGILIWDDYAWQDLPGNGPGPAIDAIVALYKDELEVLRDDYQLIVRKRR